MRILKADLDDAMSALNRVTNNTQDFSYDKAYGGYKLVRENGAWQVSSRYSKRAMYDWMCAYINGIQDGQKILSASKVEA